jgi:hypothetical protein
VYLMNVISETFNFKSIILQLYHDETILHDKKHIVMCAKLILAN